MTSGKSIRLYLPDSNVTGIRYAELVNWTGQAIACPRNRLSELQNWPESSKPGIYFLFESRLGESKPMAYIGESESVLERVITHDKKKDFWNEIVLFTSKDENLTKSHIKYLESSLINQAKSASRYELENGNIPAMPTLPRADKAAMEEFLTIIRMIIGVLGHNILEPILKQKDAYNNIQQPENLLFTINGLTAYGLQTDEGFVLKKNSQITEKFNESMPGKLASIKKRLILDGLITETSDHLIAAEDILLSSSSYAAALVAGTARSGPQSWKTKDGKTLKQLEDMQLPST